MAYKSLVIKAVEDDDLRQRSNNRKILGKAAYNGDA